MNGDAPKTNLVGLTKRDIESYFEGLGAKPFHGRNVLKWIHKHGIVDFDAMTDVPKALREQLRTCAEVVLPRIVLTQPASDGTTKWVLELADGQHVETVYIPDGDRSTICVSSQVGCALDCSFCSTAQQGFNRNLGVDEIIGQVWLATRELGQPPAVGVAFAFADDHYRRRRAAAHADAQPDPGGDRRLALAGLWPDGGRRGAGSGAGGQHWHARRDPLSRRR